MGNNFLNQQQKRISTLETREKDIQIELQKFLNAQSLLLDDLKIIIGKRQRQMTTIVNWKNHVSSLQNLPPQQRHMWEQKFEEYRLSFLQNYENLQKLKNRKFAKYTLSNSSRHPEGKIEPTEKKNPLSIPFLSEQNIDSMIAYAPKALAKAMERNPELLEQYNNYMNRIEDPNISDNQLRDIYEFLAKNNGSITGKLEERFYLALQNKYGIDPQPSADRDLAVLKKLKLNQNNRFQFHPVLPQISPNADEFPLLAENENYDHNPYEESPPFSERIIASKD